MLDRTEFAKIMKILASAKQKKFTADDMEAWYQLASMQNYPLEAWRAAAVKLAYDAGDWPTFDKLASLASEHISGISTTWEIAYDRVRDASRQASEFDSTRTEKALESLTADEKYVLGSLGGFEVFWSAEASKMGVIRAQFRDIWKERVSKSERLQNLPEQVRPRVDGDVQKRLGELAGKMRIE